MTLENDSLDRGENSLNPDADLVMVENSDSVISDFGSKMPNTFATVTMTRGSLETAPTLNVEVGRPRLFKRQLNDERM